MTLLWNGEEHEVELPLIGEFQALNAVTRRRAGAGARRNAGGGVGGHGEAEAGEGPHGACRRKARPAAHVFVDYAHTPDGLDVLLRAARPHAPGRIIAVFGCGGDRDTDKRPKMGAIAARHADVVIVTDDNPRSEDPAAIRAQILDGAPNAMEIGDRAQAIREAVAMLQAGRRADDRRQRPRDRPDHQRRRRIRSRIRTWRAAALEHDAPRHRTVKRADARSCALD